MRYADLPTSPASKSIQVGYFFFRIQKGKARRENHRKIGRYEIGNLYFVSRPEKGKLTVKARTIQVPGKQGLYSGKDAVDPADLSIECLRMVYRLMFLFYTEARSELGYVPI